MNFKNIKKTFVVAEIGVNHEGNINLAKRMINLASKAGVDAVKFQTYSHSNMFHHLNLRDLGKNSSFLIKTLKICLTMQKK